MKKAIQYFLIVLFSILSTPSFATLGSAPTASATVTAMPTPHSFSAKKHKKSEQSSRLWRKIFAITGLLCIVGSFLTPITMPALATGLLIGAGVSIIMFLIAFRFF